MRGKGGTGIKSEPPEPEDKGAQSGQGNAMTRNSSRFPVLAELPVAGSQNDGPGQTHEAAHRVHHPGAGKVQMP